MPDGISSSLERSLAIMEKRLYRQVNTDMNRRLFRVYRREAAVYFVDGMTSGDFLQHYLLAPCQRHADEHAPDALLPALLRMIPLGEVEEAESYAAAIESLMDGKAVLFVDGVKGALCFDIRAFVRRGVSAPLTESVVNGPHQGFNETLRDNITLLRRILHTPELIGEMSTLGDAIPTNLCVMYLKNAVDGDSLRRVKNRLAGLRVDHVLSIGALEQLLEDRPYALLPQCCLTERPDRAASFLLEGQVVLLLDG